MLLLLEQILVRIKNIIFVFCCHTTIYFFLNKNHLALLSTTQTQRKLQHAVLPLEPSGNPAAMLIDVIVYTFRFWQFVFILFIGPIRRPLTVDSPYELPMEITGKCSTVELNALWLDLSPGPVCPTNMMELVEVLLFIPT